ncbi:glycosyltransferase family 2 protein [Aquicoccus sp. SCR17]|nr:glycosyltransferase family 2 protein [Carideicomes alvinocaridis]
MRIVLHIGPDAWATGRIQRVLAAQREDLAKRGVLYPTSPGAANHVRLFMAASDAEAVDSLRFNRGFFLPERQAALRSQVMEGLAREVAAARPELLILSAPQLGACLARPSELGRLREMLSPLSQDISILAHVEEPARMLARHYAAQIAEGRALPLTAELELAPISDWWDACLHVRPAPDPANGLFPEVQAPPFWLDLREMAARWDAVFGVGATRLRALEPARLASAEVAEEIAEGFGLTLPAPAEAEALPVPPSDAWLSRAREMNGLLLRLVARGDRVLPRQLWRRILTQLDIAGPPLAPGALSPISERFAGDRAALLAAHPGLTEAAMRPDPALPDWQEAPPLEGFRASQYLAANLPAIDKATRAAARDKAPELAPPETLNGHALPEPSPLLPPAARERFAELARSPFRPHNRLGEGTEDAPGAPYPEVPRRALPEGSSGNVIVGCMKNEAPYIVEWVAYHRAIGIDNFLIYTNGCEDGTDAILTRLAEMGVVQHRVNDDWTGKSPQQHALNRSLKEPVIRDAEWILHIDVDEFVNVRCGDGTLQDFLDRVPGATNVAMTWRLFGHSGVARLDDRFVTEQFEMAAPKYCPKPHTVWGFKTMSRNIGAYEKLSCHRPNKLRPGMEARVKWVNGSGQDMTREAARNGWRNSRRSVGYDLLQLNHYALRSAESFLIKRQRGRALHVDRSIGLGYWIRMDWCDHRDLTIQRNLPRLRAEYDRLMQDDTLRALHEAGFDWHRAKADELHRVPEFAALYRDALDLRLDGTERAAYALALDMES